MHQWIEAALVEIMTCRLFGAKPLSQTNAGLLSISPLGTNFSEILIKIKKISLTKMHLKIYRLCEMAAILSRGGWVNSLRPDEAYTHVNWIIIGSANGLHHMGLWHHIVSQILVNIGLCNGFLIKLPSGECQKCFCWLVSSDLFKIPPLPQLTLVQVMAWCH